MKKIILLGCLICSAFAWADYEHCVDDERENYQQCLHKGAVGFTQYATPQVIEKCTEAYKFGLSQCKEVYINKGK